MLCTVCHFSSLHEKKKKARFSASSTHLGSNRPSTSQSRLADLELSRPSSGIIPGSSAVHLHSTRRSCPRLGAQRPPRGLLSCLPRGQALPGIPLALHSRGGNRLGADGEERLRDCSQGWMPTTPNPGPPRRPTPPNPPCLQTYLDPASKSYFFLHTHTEGTCVTHVHSSVTTDTYTCT